MYYINSKDSIHSIIIYIKNGDTYDEYNTYDAWHLVPAERPSVEAPPLKTRYEEIAAINGSLDLSETLFGRRYENRTGSWEFWAVDTNFGNESNRNRFETWQALYSDILSKIHGKKCYIVLQDDPEYFYEGRITISGVSTDKDHVSITFEYNLLPYKYYKGTSNTFSSTDEIWYRGMFSWTGNGAIKTLCNYYHVGSFYDELPIRIAVDQAVRIVKVNYNDTSIEVGSPTIIYPTQDPDVNTSIKVPGNGKTKYKFSNPDGTSISGLCYVSLDYSPGGIIF